MAIRSGAAAILSSHVPYAGHTIEGGEGTFDPGLIEPMEDEDDAGSMVRVRPGVEMGRRMNDMLHAMDHHRRFLTSDVQDAFYPQNLLAMAVKQHGQPESERRPVKRFIDDHRHGLDVVTVIMVTMSVPALAIEPTLHFSCLGIRIIEIARQQIVGIESRILCIDHQGLAVQLCQRFPGLGQTFRIHQVGFGQHQTIGNRGLLDRFPS